MKKIVSIITWISIISTIGLFLLITFWLTWPYKLAEQTAPAKILTPVVKNGEEVQYELSFCKYTNKTPIETRRQVVDGLIYRLPDIKPRVLPKGCRHVVAATTIILPECAECFGKNVKLELTAVYQVNPLRTMEVTFITEPFIITP